MTQGSYGGQGESGVPTKKGKTRVSRETQQTGETRKPRKAGEDRGQGIHGRPESYGR